MGGEKVNTEYVTETLSMRHAHVSREANVRMDANTTREKIADALGSEPATADELAAQFSVPAPEVLTHVKHIARSSGGDAEFLVAPPTCEQCGFDQFDDPLGQPSKCPSCRSEALEQAAFMLDQSG